MQKKTSYELAHEQAEKIVDNIILISGDSPAPPPEEREKIVTLFRDAINGIATVLAARIKELPHGSA